MPRSIRGSRPCLLVSAVLMLFIAAHSALGQGGLAASRDLEQSFIEVIARTEGSVVALANVPRAPDFDTSTVFEPLGGAAPAGGAQFVPAEFGAGVIIARGNAAAERYVLTTGHVIFGSRRFPEVKPAPVDGTRADLPFRVLARLASRHVVEATLIAADPRSDLAVLRLDLAAAGAPLDAAPPLKLGQADAVRKGQLVVVLGNPYAIARDGSASASFGMVGNISRRPAPPAGVRIDSAEEQITLHHYGTLLHVDARLDLGASGSAVVNLDGELIGLGVSLAALQGYEKSAGFAIPMDEGMRRVIDALLEGYEVEYGFLGIRPGPADQTLLARYRDLTSQASGARVLSAAVNSPAAEAGLREGDIVLALQDRPVYSELDLTREASLRGADADATLTVLRPQAGTIFTLTCRLGKWPVYDDSRIYATRERYSAWRGLHVDFPTARRRYLTTDVLGTYPRGVVITAVDPETPAAAAGLREGMFITALAGNPVRTPRDVEQAAAGLSDAVTLTLHDGRRVELAPPGVPEPE